MAWALIDVGFHDHPKVLALLDEPDALAAIGLWTMCLAWAKGHADPDNPHGAGRIPTSLVRRLGGDVHLGDLLVKAGLWEAAADGVWQIHDFAGWQQLEAWRVKRELGRKGGRPRKPRSEPSGNHMVHQPETIRPPMSQSHVMTGHEEDRTVKESEPDGSDSSSEPPAAATRDRTQLDLPGQRDDVERLCEHLASRVEQQIGKRPTIGVHWRRPARLLLDVDHHTEAQVHKAIDWAQDDEFWRANVLSMSKLREKYVQLRAAAQRNGANGTPLATSDQRAIMAIEARRQAQARDEASRRELT